MSTAAKARPRLGRGLSSLISTSHLPVVAEPSAAPPGASIPQSSPPPTADVSAPAAIAQPPQPDGRPMLIAIELVRPNPHQPRKTVNESSITELAASVKSSGIIQPIVVRRVNGHFELIAGERRWRAAQLAGMSQIPAVVHDVDPFAQAQMALIENIQREDLNPIDRAAAYRTLIDKLGLTQMELSLRLGEDRSSIANYLRLLELSEPVRDAVRDARISLGHAKILAGIADILQQQLLAQLVITKGLSVRELEERIAADADPRPAATKASGSSAHLIDLEKTISRQLGMRVQVRRGAKGKGRLIIHYSSLDQFDELLAKLGVRSE